MSQFRGKPQTPEQFIDQVEDMPAASSTATESLSIPGSTTEDYPWDAPHMVEITKTFQLRLQMKHLLMLRYIAEHSPYNVSMQKFCIDTLIPAIEQRVKELTKG